MRIMFCLEPQPVELGERAAADLPEMIAGEQHDVPDPERYG